MAPLEGIRVIDLSFHLAGPYATTMMADMGAEVIRVERPGGEEDRRIGCQLAGGDTTNFVARARNKKSLTLNLQSPEGQHILRELVKVSDVLVESYGPSARKALGIDYKSMRQINPRLIMASVSAYGSGGPSRDKIGFDAIAQAACGAMDFGGFPDDDRPARGIAWVDYSTAIHTGMGIMLALWDREKTGKGQVVDVSLYDTATNLVGLLGVYADKIVNGITRPKVGNASVSVYADTFKAKNGWIFIELARNSIWSRFAKLVGREDLTNDPRLDSDTKRIDNRRLIDEVIVPWVAGRTVDELTGILQAARIPCQKINTVSDALADPQLKYREMLVDVDYPGAGKVPIPGVVIKLSESPGEIRTRAPLLGEHNEEILTGLLGYKLKDVAKLRKQGVI